MFGDETRGTPGPGVPFMITVDFNGQGHAVNGEIRGILSRMVWFISISNGDDCMALIPGFFPNSGFRVLGWILDYSPSIRDLTPVDFFAEVVSDSCLCGEFAIHPSAVGSGLDSQPTFGSPVGAEGRPSPGEWLSFGKGSERDLSEVKLKKGRAD